MKQNVLNWFCGAVLLFVSSALCSFAQSDGTSGPADTPLATSAKDVGTVLPAETATTTEVAPRVLPMSTTTAATAPAPPRSKPFPPPSVPKVTKDEMLVLPVPKSAPQKSSNPLFPALIAFGAVILLAPYGMYRLLRDTKDKKPKDEGEGGRCDDIKKLLERKKSTLEIVSGTISVKQALIKLLIKKIEEKKEELKDEIKEEIVDTAVGEEEGGKIMRSVKEVKDTYDELVEKLEQASSALEYFSARRKNLSDEAGKIEAAYQTCLLGDSVFAGASRFGRGLELFEASLNQKLYRYTSGGEGIFSIGKRSLPKELVKEANKARKWLPRPELPEGEHKFFFTAKGKESYEKTLLLVHKKYLADIRCEEVEYAHIGEVAYEDEWQVVAK